MWWILQKVCLMALVDWMNCGFRQPSAFAGFPLTPESARVRTFVCSRPPALRWISLYVAWEATPGAKKVCQDLRAPRCCSLSLLLWALSNNWRRLRWVCQQFLSGQIFSRLDGRNKFEWHVRSVLRSDDALHFISPNPKFPSTTVHLSRVRSCWPAALRGGL